MTRFSFYPIGDEHYLLVAAVAVALVAMLAIGSGKLSRGRRVTLTVLRLGVILTVLWAMLRPTIVYSHTTKQAATLVILADQSRSMSVRDEANGRTRWEALKRALADAARPLARVARDFEVKAYAFDSDLHPAEVAGGEVRLGDKPEGRQTAIGAVLEDIQRENAGKRLLGVILLSDGAQRARAPRDVLPQTAAAQLKNSGPLFAVRLGKSRGLGQTQDVAITGLLADPRVFVKNVLTVTGQVRIDGFVNREIPVQLQFETAPGKMTTVAEQKVKVSSSGQIAPFEFRYVPDRPGEFKLAVAIAPQPGELVTNNNHLSTFVHVLSGGLKVLYLEGTPRVESRFLRRSLGASSDINVRFVRLDLRRPDDRPEDLATCFKPGQFDVYILGDLDSSLLKADEVRALAERVTQGAGLIMLGGYQSFGPGGYASTPLADVLPVVMDRFERQKPDEPIREGEHIDAGPAGLKMLPTQMGVNHFSLSLGGTPRENMEQWRKLPGLEGANKVRKLKPWAMVLAETEKAEPLLVTQNFGNGRVMAFMGDSTWHWWMRGFEASHKRFWRQVVLWLARKDESMGSDVWVKLAEHRFLPGQPVEFEVGVQGGRVEPEKGVKFEAQVIPPSGRASPVQLAADQDKTRGSFRETESPGDYIVQVTARKDGKELGQGRARFAVLDQDLELDNSAADADLLESLGTISGGKWLPPEDLRGLIEQLSKDTQSLEVQVEAKVTLWDTWTVFSVLVGLLGLEWYLRKRWGLV
jgi:hypothetical protein